MTITCDVGNTNIKTALFVDNEISELKTFNDTNELFSFLNKNIPDSFALSSVVPAVSKKIKYFLQHNLKISPFIINKDVNFNLKINYISMETLGIDRICSAEGAFYLYKNSGELKNYSEKTFIITIDFGTATTINIIKYPGEFIGGLIAPGIKMMFNSLSQNTALLPSVSDNDYDNIIAQDTKSSIASGVLNSSLGLIGKVLSHLKNIYNAEDLKIFITGGNADKITPHIDFEFSYQKALVLLGAKAIMDLNK